MGIGGPALSLLSLLYNDNKLKNFDSVCEIGAQEINKNHPSLALDFPFDINYKIREIHIEEKQLHKSINAISIYKKININKYCSIDMNGLFGSYEFDLNYNIKDKYQFTNQFDLITNFGTTEHLINQGLAFENIHNLCKKNGLMIGIIPFQGAYNHGFINYQPIFFEELARVNDYEIGMFWAMAAPQLYTQTILPFNKEFIKILRNKVKNKWLEYLPYEFEESLCYVLQKREEKKFIFPSQVYTGEKGSRINSEFVKKRICEDYFIKNQTMDQLIQNHFLNYSQRNFKISLFRILKMLFQGEILKIFNKIIKKLSK